MSNLVTKRRLGVALVGLAVPFALAMPAAAQQPDADATGLTAQVCVIDLGFTGGDCGRAIAGAIVDIAEADVNADLADQGIPYVVDTGLGTPPLDVVYTTQSPGVPVPPPPVILPPGVEAPE